MMIDPFKDGFSLTQLSQAINVLPNMYGRANELGLFAWRAQTTPSVTIEMSNGVLTLVLAKLAPQNKATTLAIH